MRPRVVISSGGTKQKIDEFRLITNVSTGKLGAMFAEYFCYQGWDVEFVYTRHSIKPEVIKLNWWDKNIRDMGTIQYHEVESAQDAMDVLELIVPRAEAIIHAMAVADFGFKKDDSIKLKSDDPKAFIKYMSKRLIVNPKIISNFRKWNTDPDFYIVGFKFEIGKTLEELREIAVTSLMRNNCNIVVANDKAEMKKRGDHIGHIVLPDGSSDPECEGKAEIVKLVYTRVNNHVVLARADRRERDEFLRRARS